MTEPAPSNTLQPWLQSQLGSLLQQRGHAWLLSGPSGLGQYPLALALVQAWLCDRPSAQGACQDCDSCHAVAVRAHADLCVLMPETVMLELGWPLPEKAQDAIDKKERKPSKEIRVEAMRDAIEFAQRTSARNRGKAMLVFPAERMNHVTANALLKTLEEPPGDMKFVLATGAAHQLLPTIRSRCLGHAMLWPDAPLALAWMQAAGGGLDLAEARVLLRAAGGRPDNALDFVRQGRDARQWAALPKAVARGDVTPFKDWTSADIVDAMHKLCHDMLALRVGANPRFFAAGDLPGTGSVAALTQWGKALSLAARTVEHPFNAGLMAEALVSEAKNVLNSRP